MPTTEIRATASPRPLLELATAFWRAKTLLTAVDLGVFNALADGPASGLELRDRLDLHPRSAQDFFDALVALGLLERTDDGGYRNGQAADLYLVEDRPTYLGGWMRMTDRRLYEAWRHLGDGLRTGQPQLAGPMSDNFFPNLYQDPQALRRFIAGMDALTAKIGPEVAGSFDWTGVDTFVDVGGARGNFASSIAAAHPHLRGTCFDLPHLEPLFDDLVAERGIGGRLSFAAGDFFADPLPPADVLILGHILHDWNVEQRQSLLAKAYDAVRPGGALLVYDRMIDDARSGATLSLLGSLNLLLVTPGGSEYTVADCRGWLTDAGFARTSAVPVLDGTETLVIARKAKAS